ncbi:MAG: glycoside hydrolase family 28 protein, partial [Planctomycetes bacterium]|nr:glycoside hydrolase family 28 protein [Planctomycetota bacterium]
MNPSFRPLPALLVGTLCIISTVCASRKSVAVPRDDANGDYDVRAYGAVGDGDTLDTAAIQEAIDAAAEAGGGTVLLRRGTFLSGTLVMKSNVSLDIEAGAVLRASRDIADYPDHTPRIVFLYQARFTKSLIYADRAENISLTGRGLIDGQGEHFPARPGDDKQRPYILRFSECRNVLVRDLTFRNSARWLSHYLACENVAIEGITIHSRIRENRDGLDIDSCSGVRVSDCHIETGDDAIVLKATTHRPCRRVTISNCVLSSMASALKLGTESNGGFEDVTISNCTIFDTGYSGIGLMVVDGGTLDGVSISNITMRDVKVPIFVRLGNRARAIPGEEPPGVGAVRNVTISNVQATGVGDTGCSITGIPDHPVENVTLDNIRIRLDAD